jgi:hypothetical protein
MNLMRISASGANVLAYAYGSAFLPASQLCFRHVGFGDRRRPMVNFRRRRGRRASLLDLLELHNFPIPVDMR